jgi:murein endopeptidase
MQSKGASSQSAVLSIALSLSALATSATLAACGSQGQPVVTIAAPGPIRVESEAPASSSARSSSLAEGASLDDASGGTQAMLATGGVAPCPREAPLELEDTSSVSDADLLKMFNDSKFRAASASIGRAARGALYGAIELPESDGIAHAGGYAWGTANVVHALERAVRQVRDCFRDTPRLFIGDISKEHGGWLGPHASHQAGLDVDVGYYYVTPPLWYIRATAKNLDVPRTRALLRALIEGGNVEMIFMDRSVQNLLKRGPKEAPGGDVPDDDWFERPLKRDAIIRQEWGHATHFHVRFRDDGATALGDRLVDLLPPVHPLRYLRPTWARAH